MRLVPNIKAAEKWVRQTQKRAKRNLDTKTKLKTLYKKAKDGERGVPAVESQFDKAAQRGIIHPNKAARKKSRLSKALRTATLQAQAGASAAAPTKARTTKTRAKGRR